MHYKWAVSTSNSTAQTDATAWFTKAPNPSRHAALRTYLDTLAKASAGTRKVVIGPTNTSDILMFNLEDKLRPDLEGIAIDTPPAKK